MAAEVGEAVVAVAAAGEVVVEAAACLAAAVAVAGRVCLRALAAPRVVLQEGVVAVGPRSMAQGRLLPDLRLAPLNLRVRAQVSDPREAEDGRRTNSLRRDSDREQVTGWRKRPASSHPVMPSGPPHDPRVRPRRLPVRLKALDAPARRISRIFCKLGPAVVERVFQTSFPALVRGEVWADKPREGPRSSPPPVRELLGQASQTVLLQGPELEWEQV